MTNTLTIFNHKGGVGKTTLTVNLAFALAEKGKRVLVVDADPQCNVSSYLLEAEVLDDFLDNSDSDDGRTLWSALKPIVDGTGDVRQIAPIEMPTEGLFLIPGDIRLSEFERELEDFWTLCIQRRSRGYFGANSISRLIQKTAKDLGIDIVLYDVGPNIGPLNRVILLDCEGFIIPVACDVFSLRALTTVGRSIVKWVEEWKTICELAPSDTPMLTGRPRLLGYIPQQFRVYGGEPASNPKTIMGQIDRKIRDDVVRVLQSKEESLIDNVSGSKIGEVKDFGTLIARSQQDGRSLWNMNAGTPDQRSEAKRVFYDISETILRRLG